MSRAEFFRQYKQVCPRATRRQIFEQYRLLGKNFERGSDIAGPPYEAGGSPPMSFIAPPATFAEYGVRRPARLLTYRNLADGYDATAFLMRHFGEVWNVHLTVTWLGLGISDEKTASKILALFNKEAAAWLRVGSYMAERQRNTKRSFFGGHRHFYLYVHENSKERGFHTHQLMVIPIGKAREFEVWCHAALTRLAACDKPAATAVYLTPQTVNSGLKPRKKSVDRGLGNCRRWFSYIMKGLAPDPPFLNPQTGNMMSVRDAFRLDPFRPSLAMSVAKVSGCSENLSRGARHAARFHSKIDNLDLTELRDRLFDGSELDEYQRDQDQAKREADLQEVLDGLRI